MLLSDSYTDFQQRIRDTLLEKVSPLVDEYEERGEFPLALIKELGSLGLMGIPIPSEHGGMGMDTLSYAIAVEEISRIWGSLGITVAAHTSLGSYPFYLFGNDSQKEKFLKPLARGEKIGAFGLTEPEAGSDSGSTRTTAQLSSGKFIVNGVKCFITSGGYADTFIITAATEVPKKGVSALIVEKGTPGFSIGKSEDKLGLKASDTSTLIFENCLIPEENLLGSMGEGFKIFLKTLDGGRISIGAMALGLAQGAMDTCLQYISDKKLLDPDIFTRQIAKAELADMYSQILAARSLVYHAARMKDSGKPFTLESASAKLFASETAMKVTSDALSLIGAEGFSKKYPASRLFKDTKVTQIGEGTSEIQRLVIARELLRQHIK